MCFDEIHICGKILEWKVIVSLELVKVGSYDIRHACDGPPNSHLFF
jgi:hypothetical protein